MILYIYLGISMLAFILLLLKNISLVHNAKLKLKDFEEVNDKDIAGSISSYLKLAVICFIPLINIVMLFIVLFCENELNKRADKLIDEAINKRNSRTNK